MTPPAQAQQAASPTAPGATTQPGDQVYRTAIIRPGVYTPGGGPLAGKRIAITEQFLQDAGPTLEGEPVNLEHSQSVNDEIGFHRNVALEEDEQGMVLRADLQVQASRPRFDDAVSFIESRLSAGETPEYSMELPTPALEWREAEPGETFQGEPFDIMLTDGAFAGGALLSEGACTAEDGCGVGLSTGQETTDFCPSCGEELPCNGSRTSVATGLSGTTRKRTTMSEEQDDEGSSGDTSPDIEQLKSDVSDLKGQFEEAQSREDPDEEPSEVETELEATREQLRGELTSQIEAARGEDYVEDTLGEDPSLEQLETARNMIQAEASDDEREDPGEEDGDAGGEGDTEASSAGRKTSAQRQPGQDTIVTRTGQDVSVPMLNSVRERFGLDPVEEGSRDLNPSLPSAFKRAEQAPDGKDTLFHHMGGGS